jgi:hypothetical protein
MLEIIRSPMIADDFVVAVAVLAAPQPDAESRSPDGSL